MVAEHGHRRIGRRQALTGLMTSARELRLTPNSDPIGDLYDPQTGMPR